MPGDAKEHSLLLESSSWFRPSAARWHPICSNWSSGDSSADSVSVWRQPSPRCTSQRSLRHGCADASLSLINWPIVIGLTLAVVVCWWLSHGENWQWIFSSGKFAAAFQDHWRWMFASEALPILALLVGLLFIPNSPRWLASKGNDAQAYAVLRRINGPERAQRELADIREELGEEPGGFNELFRPGIFTALLIGVAIMVFSQINGVNMVLLYTPSIFEEAGFSKPSDAIFNTIFVDLWITVCTVVAFGLTAWFGRRPILIVGTLCMALGHLLIFLRFAFELPVWVIFAGIFVTSGAFTLSLAPLSWVILSEIFPNRIRAKAMSLSTSAMYAASFITVYFFPAILDYFKQTFGNPGGTFLIFLGICVSCSLFVWRFVPETKDRTLEEIGQYWLRQSK